MKCYKVSADFLVRVFLRIHTDWFLDRNNDFYQAGDRTHAWLLDYVTYNKEPTHLSAFNVGLWDYVKMKFDEWVEGFEEV